jgi:hypothetical protein
MPDNNDNDLDFKPRLDGPIRRNLGIILAVVAVLVVGPTLSKVLKSYRGIVLEVRDDTMFVALMDLPPKWMDTIGAQPGQVIAKEAFGWSPGPAEPLPIDDKLLDLYDRYTLTYQGAIVEVLPPASQGGTTSAVVQTVDGKQQVIKLVAEHLLDAGKGDRVEKKIYTWDPEVVEKAPLEGAPSDGATLAPPEGADEPPAKAGAAPANDATDATDKETPPSE